VAKATEVRALRSPPTWIANREPVPGLSRKQCDGIAPLGFDSSALRRSYHVGNTRKTPLDECGHVYKDLDEVLNVLEEEGIARAAHRLYPVANMKGMD